MRFLRYYLLLHLISAGCVTASGAVGNPTALELQLLGAYDELDQDLVRASSVRADGKLASVTFDTIKQHALEYRSLQRFNEDDLLELKNKGCIAESLDATVTKRGCTIGKEDPAAPRRIKRVVEEENRARKAILTWAAYELARRDGRAAPTLSELEEIRRAYGRLLRETAANGHLIEVAPGSFEKHRGE